MEDRLEPALYADYLEACVSTKTEFNQDKYEEYLDRLFDAMSEIFMEVNNGN